MKKLAVVVATLLVCVTSHAQLGVVAGLTSSRSDIKSAVSEYKEINQFHAGLCYKITLGGCFAIQPAVIYNMKGSRIADISNIIKDANLEYKTGFVEVPVQLQLGLKLGNLARLYGIAEPFAGFAVKNTVNAGGSSQNTWDNIANRLEYGLGLGAGVELFSHVQVSCRYFWNMDDLYSDGFKSKCKGITASVAFIL